MLECIKLDNFTVFKDGFTADFVPGVNVFVGLNGTGKTHLLKGIYADAFGDGGVFREVFKDGELRRDIGRDYSFVGYKDEAGLNNEAVFIPAKDMLTHANGLLAMADRYQGKSFPFDRTLLDVVRKAAAWQLKNPSPLALVVMPTLEKLMGGHVVVEREEFFLQKNDGRRVSFNVEAEGLKKLGLLWQLLANETITERSVLIWDEPEANLNPSFYADLVACLLRLAEHGVQIFLSTHNYIFAKYFDVVRVNRDDVRFHSLYFTEAGVDVEAGAMFGDLQHNAIMSSFDKLLDEVYEI